MAYTLLKQGQSMRSRTKTSRSFRSLALLSTATPVLLALASGCGDTINNSYNYYQGSAAGEGGEGPSMPHAGSTSLPEGGSAGMNGGGGSGGSVDGGSGGEVTS